MLGKAMFCFSSIPSFFRAKSRSIRRKVVERFFKQKNQLCASQLQAVHNFKNRSYASQVYEKSVASQSGSVLFRYPYIPCARETKSNDELHKSMKMA